MNGYLAEVLKMSKEFHQIHHSYIGDVWKTTELLSLNCLNGTLGQWW